MENIDEKGYVHPLEVVETLQVEVGAGEQVDLESMTIKIRGKHGVALLKVFGKAEKPEAAAVSFEVVDGILKCKGEGIVVENGILKLPVGEVRDGILYL